MINLLMTVFFLHFQNQILYFLLKKIFEALQHFLCLFAC